MNSHKIREKLINEGKDLSLVTAIESLTKVNGVKQWSSSWHRRGAVVQKEIFKHTFQGTNAIMWQMWRCSAVGKTCLKCGKANHFARMCRTSNKEVHEVTETDYQVSDSWFVETISEDKKSPNQVFVEIELGHSKETVSFKLDTGAQVNVIPSELSINSGGTIWRKTPGDCVDMGKTSQSRRKV